MNVLSHLSHPQPASQLRSSVYRLRLDGEEIDVLDAGKADFAVFESFGPVEVEIISDSSLKGASVKPLSKKIVSECESHRVRFTIEKNIHLCLEVPGLKPLFIYANSPEREKPSPTDSSVRYFGGGRIHNVGRLELKSGETLYIEAGTVIRGQIVCSGARDVKIRGRGILDGSCYSIDRGEHIQMAIFERCENVLVEDIIMIEPTSWMLVLACCNNVHVNGLKQIGSCISSDGIDICGSKNVLVENCCLRNDDDNVVIKSLSHPGRLHWEGDVEHVRVRHCTFLNGQPGNVMEIGYELATGHVRDIVFEDIDVISAHGEGAVFSIHNGDRAIVENVRWENIRVDHYWDKLIDFRVVNSRYNKDSQRGIIRNIELKNIRVTHSVFNPGCSLSVISGYSADSPVKNITLNHFFLNDKKVCTADDLDLHTRNAEDIHFL